MIKYVRGSEGVETKLSFFDGPSRVHCTKTFGDQLRINRIKSITKSEGLLTNDIIIIFQLIK